MIPVQDIQDHCVFALPPVVDMRNIADIAAGLKQAVQSSSLVIDASALEVIGTCGLQVLIAASRSMAERRAAFSVTHPPEALIAACRICGLMDEFEIWTAAAAKGEA